MVCAAHTCAPAIAPHFTLRPGVKRAGQRNVKFFYRAKGKIYILYIPSCDAENISPRQHTMCRVDFDDLLCILPHSSSNLGRVNIAHRESLATHITYIHTVPRFTAQYYAISVYNPTVQLFRLKSRYKFLKKAKNTYIVSHHPPPRVRKTFRLICVLANRPRKAYIQWHSPQTTAHSVSRFAFAARGQTQLYYSECIIWIYLSTRRGPRACVVLFTAKPAI